MKRILPDKILKEIETRRIDLNTVTEIRIRKNRPSYIRTGKSGLEISKLMNTEFDTYLCYLCKHSPYAYSEEIKNGFLSLPGGHRVGVSGQVVCKDGIVEGMNYISSLNIRIHREVKGCILPILNYLYENGRWKNTLIVSVPGAGKTTLLRDLVRQASMGTKELKPCQVALIDERNEISASILGIPELDIGPNTDCLVFCQKSVGVLMMLRSMAPEIIAFDELGGTSDYDAIRKAFVSGVGIFTTIHGNSRKDLENHKELNLMLQQNLFERIIYLDGNPTPGCIKMVTDSQGFPVFRG